MENKVPKIILQSGYRQTRTWVLLSIIGVLLLFMNQNVSAQTPVQCETSINFHLVGVDATSATANDAKIRISGALSGNNKVGYSVGNTYTGPNFATATKISDLTGGYISETLPTPTNTAGTEYTIRVYSEEGTCYTDKTFTLAYVNFNTTPVFPDIKVTMGASPGGFVALNSTVSITVTVTNEGTGPATGLVYTVAIPAGLTGVTGTTATGSFSGTTWTIGSLAAGATPVTLTLTGTVSTRGVKYVAANLTAENEQDFDSSPATQNAGEDDQGTICVSTPFDFCSNDEYTVTLPNYKGIKWFRGGTEIIFDAQGNAPGVKMNLADSSLVIFSEGEYTYTKLVGLGACTSGNCCPIKIEAGKPPVLAALTNQSICLNATFDPVTAQNTQTAPNGTFIYQWYNANGTNNADTLAIAGQNSLSFTAFPTAVGVYKYKLKAYEQGHENCATEVTFTLTIRDLPVISVAPVPAVCAEDTISLSVVGSVTGDTFAWTGPDNFTASVANPDRLNAIEGYEGTYVVTVTNGAACSASATTAVTVNPLPADLTTTPKVFCEGDAKADLTLNVSNIAASNTLLWYGQNSTGGVGTTVMDLYDPTTPGPNTFYVSQKDVNGCISHRVPLSVMVNAKPETPILVDNVTYCKGVQASPLEASNISSGYTVNWYDNTGSVIKVANQYTPSTDEVKIFTVYITQTNPTTTCTSNRDSVLITINRLPDAPGVNPVVYCEGDVVAPNALTNLITSTEAGNTVAWYGGGSTSATPQQVNTSVAGLTMFYLTQTIPGTGCESPMAAIPVTVNPKPVATVIAVNSLCVGTVSQNNAQLVLTRYRNSDEVSYNIGGTYGTPTPSTYATVPSGGVFASNLPNPTTASQDYTVRIKNSFECTVDRLVTITKADCACPGGYCEPATVTKTK